jgi:multidrug efflux pump subunit AcrB
VLLDYVEQLRARGVGAIEALVDAGTTRLRPVLLTAGTTVLGLIPMAIGVSLDIDRWRLVWGGTSNAFWGPMAIAVIFGLAVATVLTLVMVPTVYAIFEDLWRALGLSTKYEAEPSDPPAYGGGSAGALASAKPAE